MKKTALFVILCITSAALLASPAAALTIEARGVTLPSQQVNYKTQAIDRSRAKAILRMVATASEGVGEQYLTGITAKEALAASQSFVRGYTILEVAERDLLYQVNIAWDIDMDALEALLFSRLLDEAITCTVLLYQVKESHSLWDTLDTLGSQDHVHLDKILLMDDNKALFSLRTQVNPSQMLAPLLATYQVSQDENCYIIIEAKKEEES